LKDGEKGDSVMSLSDDKRIIIKVKVDISKKRSQNRRPGRDDAQQTPQSKRQNKQTSGQESQTGFGTKTSR
jgi:hypothetical protein